MIETIDECIAHLKQHNVRITPQRYAILAYLIETDTHPTADDIYQALMNKFSSMSVATIYNSLKLFIRLNLVTELKYGDTSSRFDFMGHKHYHVICMTCGQIDDIHYEGLATVEQLAHEKTQYNIMSHRLELYGVCPECQRLPNTKFNELEE